MYALVFHCNSIGRSITKVLFTVRYTKRQMTALTFFAITNKKYQKSPEKTEFSDFKG